MNNSSVFGDQLRFWRRARGATQLELSETSGYSQRHLSFLESGRAQPSRETVIVLADSLDVPVGDRNALLAAAGFAPLYTQESLVSNHLAFAREAFETVLESHRPFPAILVDRAWNSYGANATALDLFARFLHTPEKYDTAMNAIRVCLEETGLKPCIVNWHGFARAMLGQLKGELQRAVVHEQVADLVREIQDALEREPPHREDVRFDEFPVTCLRLERGDVALNLFTMMSAFNLPVDATVAELRVETFFPADRMTRDYLLALDQGKPHAPGAGPDVSTEKDLT